MKAIRNILVFFLLLMAAWWVMGKMDILPSFGKIFAPKEVVIDQTPILIQQIRPLAQLVTITAYTEVTADTVAKTSIGERLRDVFNPFSIKVKMNRELVIVGNVVVQAGVNLQKLTPQQLFISGDSISLQLPPAEILDVILNPSATDIFLEEGKWDNAAVINLKQKIGAKAVADVRARGVLLQAEERAREVLLNFFLAAGFTKVNIVKSRLG